MRFNPYAALRDAARELVRRVEHRRRFGMWRYVKVDHTIAVPAVALHQQAQAAQSLGYLVMVRAEGPDLVFEFVEKIEVDGNLRFRVM